MARKKAAKQATSKKRTTTNKKTQANFRIRIPKFKFYIPRISIRIKVRKKTFYATVLAILIILIADTSIQLYFQRKVVAYSQKGLIVSKYEILENFLDSVSPTAPQYILQQILAEKILEKEAKIKGIVVSEAEVNKQLNDILERNNISVEQLAVQTGTTVEGIHRLIRYNLITKKLISFDYTPTEEEIKNFYETNKTSVFKDKTYEEAKPMIESYLKQEYAQRKYSEWYYEKLNEYNVIQLLDAQVPYRPGAGLNYFGPIIINTLLDTNLPAPLIKFDLPKPLANLKDKVISLVKK